MPGSGKSSLASFLSKETGCPSIDTDREVEMLTGMSIPEIWSSLGEPGFRALERYVLFRVIVGPPAIVSTGGGLPCFFDNMALMSGFDTVFLDVAEEELHARNRHRDLPLFREGGDRLETLKSLRASRLSWYQAASFTFSKDQDQEAFLNFFKSYFLD